MALPGDLGISERPPGGESHLSAHDFSARYVSLAAMRREVDEHEGKGATYHCRGPVHHSKSRFPVIKTWFTDDKTSL